jgi:carboxypeptidase PM20D1
MAALRRIVLGLLLVLVVLVAVIAVRTWTYRAPDVVTPVELATAPPIDVERATTRLAEAVRLRTVSHQTPAENDTAEWDKLHAWLQSTYPAAHAAMSREVVAGHTLIYTWTGRDPALPAIILMAHQDVVPVTSGTEGDWQHPPFDGVIADGAVWGRGTIDDKGSLVALFEGLDALATAGFAPRRTVIVVSGHDEEAGGSGAHAAAQHLRERNLRAEFALDEGYAVIEGLSLVPKPVALIGVGEKGYAT